MTRHASLGAFASPSLPRDIAVLCHSISISMICEGQCSLTCIRRENDKDRKDSGASDDTKKGLPEGSPEASEQ